MASTTPDALTLDEEERDLVEQELRALLPALDGDRAVGFGALREEAADGEVSSDLVPLLEGLVVLALQSARARSLYRAEGERVFAGLFRRTPRGKELSDELAGVNSALRTLKAKPITGLRVGMRTLGHFTLAIDTEGASVTLAFRADGVRLEAIAAGAAGG